MPEGAGVGPRVSQTPFSSLGVPGEPLCCQQGFKEFPFHCHGHSGWHFLSSQGQPGPIQAVQAYQAAPAFARSTLKWAHVGWGSRSRSLWLGAEGDFTEKADACR